MPEVSRSAAVTTAQTIRTETVDNQNTPERVGSHLRNVVDSVLWNNKGTAAARPASSTVVGDHYFATDTKVLSIWDGTTWTTINAAIPTAGGAPVNVTKAAASAGAAATFSRSDHKHDVDTASPVAVQAGDTQNEGTATSLARSDHRHAVSVAAPVNVTKAANSAGTAQTLARSDHKHNVDTAAPAAGAVAIGNAAGEGSSTSLARADHQHAVTAGDPVNVTKAANAPGTAATFSRSDHKHDVSTATAGAITDSTNGEGSATTLARSDHQHAHGDRGGGTLHAVASDTVPGFMSQTDKAKLNAIPAGATGNVQYHNGAGNLGAEAAFTYDAANDRLTVPTVRNGTKAEIYESGAGSNEKLWDKRANSDVLEERTRTDADGAGNTYRQIERQGTAVSRAQYMTQYGLAEVADSYSEEIDTASTPAASSIYRDKAGAALALSAGFTYVFEVSVDNHVAGPGYESGVYRVVAVRPTGGNVELVETEGTGQGTKTGLDMQFAHNTTTQQITCQPTVSGEASHRKVRWTVRLARRTAIVTTDT